jgi:molecular chaperone GrpE
MAEHDDTPRRTTEAPGAMEAPAGREGSAGPEGTTRTRERDAELAAAREEARQHHERWVRERADLENLKKRMERERVETVKFAAERLCKDLLPVVDNLERALEHARDGGNGQPLQEGVALVLKSLLDVLEHHGVKRIDAQGARFDPTHHEALAHVESAEHEPSVVIEEYQRGYRLHDRLLRPALVSVAKAPAAGDKLAKDEGGD